MSDEARHGADGFLSDVTAIRAAIRTARCLPTRPFSVTCKRCSKSRAHRSRRALERAWSGRTFHVVYSRPLLLLAALRADALTEGQAHPLYRAVGTDQPRAEEASLAAVRAALAPERGPIFAALADALGANQ